MDNVRVKHPMDNAEIFFLSVPQNWNSVSIGFRKNSVICIVCLLKLCIQSLIFSSRLASTTVVMSISFTDQWSSMQRRCQALICGFKVLDRNWKRRQSLYLHGCTLNSEVSLEHPIVLSLASDGCHGTECHLAAFSLPWSAQDRNRVTD